MGRRGGSSYGEGGRGMRKKNPTISQILGPPWTGFSLSRFFANAVTVPLIYAFIKIHKVGNDAIFCGSIDTFEFISGMLLNLKNYYCILKLVPREKNMARNLHQDVEIVY